MTVFAPVNSYDNFDAASDAAKKYADYGQSAFVVSEVITNTIVLHFAVVGYDLSDACDGDEIPENASVVDVTHQ